MNNDWLKLFNKKLYGNVPITISRACIEISKRIDGISA
jgi:hypothetical protein